MKKFSLVLVLFLVVALGGVTWAFPPEIPPVEFEVEVGPWATVEITNPPLLKIMDGSASGTTSAHATITTNTPWRISIYESRVAEEASINNWFYFEHYLGGTRITGGNPGGGIGGHGVLKAGVHDLRMDLTVKSTHQIAGFPRPQEWHTLLAGKYRSTVTLTIAAAE